MHFVKSNAVQETERVAERNQQRERGREKEREQVWVCACVVCVCMCVCEERKSTENVAMTR